MVTETEYASLAAIVYAARVAPIRIRIRLSPLRHQATQRRRRDSGVPRSACDCGLVDSNWRHA